MANIYDHKSFYGFFPSEMFNFGDNTKTIQKLELSNRDLSALIKLKKLYKESMPVTLGSDEIVKKCEYAKQLLKLSNEDIKTFNENNQRTAVELVSLLSLFISLLALGASVFGTANALSYYLLFGVIAAVGACWSYVHSTNMRRINSKQVELYRQMLMCFETVEEMARESKKP